MLGQTTFWKVFGLTCRHLFFAEPYAEEEDKVYHYKHRSGEPRCFISLPGDRRLGELKEHTLKEIKIKIGSLENSRVSWQDKKVA